jgi:DNA modification methylase
MPSLNWIGKEAVEHHHKEVPYRLVHCDGALSAGDPDAGNLLVQGDNLEALKALLPYYGGQVKCIYIDPPYNTGSEEWKYNDNVSSPEIRRWLGQVVGREGEDLSRHDKWLCMMYPRLRLLRDFLRDDGAIFVSIDANECEHLQLMMNEIFGRQNFVEKFIWKKSYGGGAKEKYAVTLHEYVLMYARNMNHLDSLWLPARDDIRERYYKLSDEHFETRGPYRIKPLEATKSMDARPNLVYPIPHPDGSDVWPIRQWWWKKERTLDALSKNELVFTESGGVRSVSYKQYLIDDSGDERLSKPFSIIDKIYTQNGTAELRDIFGDLPFPFPKPSSLIADLIYMMTRNENDAIILDSFGGSGTTGQAVLGLNRQDEGSRKFILIEMMADIAENITSERLRRVIHGYNKGGDQSKPVPGLGGGFRYCRLGVPLFNEFGDIDGEVSFPDLAAHVFFAETGAPIPAKAQVGNAYLGKHGEKAVYLLYAQGLEGTPREALGNVLTPDALAALPPAPEGFEGTRVVYAEGTTVSPDRLKAEGVVFKQIPYQIAGV